MPTQLIRNRAQGVARKDGTVEHVPNLTKITAQSSAAKPWYSAGYASSSSSKNSL